MGKLESNKLQKRTSLLDTAFNLFTTKGVAQTSIAEIAEKAGIAKGTFYLYFKDKYDIRNKLISHQSGKLFKEAVKALEKHKKRAHNELSFEDKIVFIVDYIINVLEKNPQLLMFISKNLSWGIFEEALATNVDESDINFSEMYLNMLDDAGIKVKDAQIMLFLIIELVSSSCYSSILRNEPVDIATLKPYLFGSIRAIINENIIE